LRPDQIDAWKQMPAESKEGLWHTQQPAEGYPGDEDRTAQHGALFDIGFRSIAYRAPIVGIEVSGVMTVAPIWVAMVPTAVLPIVWVMRRIRGSNWRERVTRGLCGRCGYDLRASPDRCPECGEPNPHRAGIAGS
jgi:hypothetical protein